MMVINDSYVAFHLPLLKRDSNHFLRFTVLVGVAFTKKKKRKNKEKTKKTASKANTKPSTGYCSVRMRILHILWFLEMSIHGESKSTTSCVFLSISWMSTSIFEYEYCECNIKMSMNAYNYPKLEI